MMITTTNLLTLDADWVATMNGPPIRRGRVVVEAGRIAAVGPVADVPARGRHRDLGSALLSPGLINAHCHLELSAWHGTIPPGDLWTWLGNLVRQRMQPGAAEKERAAIPEAVRSMLQAGTTCVGDIHRAAWLPAALADTPIRKVCYAELISGATSPPRTPAEIGERLAAMPDDPLMAKGISPHAPYTVTPADLTECVRMARQQRLPLAIHLAETREEVQWLTEGTGPVRQWHQALFRSPPDSPRCGPSRYAVASGAADLQGCALIHMNYAEDWKHLLDLDENRRPVVVYCPRSHAFFGHEPHPFEQMLAAGLKVAIGTDSSASHAASEACPLSVLDEIRWLHAQHPRLPADTLWQMATVNAAAALGLASMIGRIVPGCAADLAAFPLESGTGAEPLEQVLETDVPAICCFVADQEPGASADPWQADA